ncbi:DMT family transporter [Hydrocarboniphaga sp.]|uniref:DMT family transporter n=1 Tax=Hydrocarboniphaga sp. TaxID=2033016 RepID=UPI003D0FDA0C
MTSASTSARPHSDTLAGLAFVFIWSTGYIAAPAALHGMGPYTLACLRFFGSALLIALALLIRGATRPATRTLMHAAVAGALLQAGFFGFTYAALRSGLPAAAAGLITGLMPLTTSLGGAFFLREKLRASAIVGLVVGLAGVLLVIAPALAQPASTLGYGLMLLALLSLSGGTLYQKRFVSGIDPLLSLLAQLLSAMLILAPAAWLVDGFRLHWSPIAIAGLSWAIVMNSCIGLLLMLSLLARGASGKVASLFYLVPPTTAVLAALILGVHFGLRDAAGFALAATGVWLGQRA